MECVVRTQLTPLFIPWIALLFYVVNMAGRRITFQLRWLKIITSWRYTQPHRYVCTIFLDNVLLPFSYLLIISHVNIIMRRNFYRKKTNIYMYELSASAFRVYYLLPLPPHSVRCVAHQTIWQMKGWQCFKGKRDFLFSLPFDEMLACSSNFSVYFCV